MPRKKKHKNPNKDERVYRYKEYLPVEYDDSPSGESERRIREKFYKKKIEWDQFEKLCQMGFSKKDICSWFGVSDRTMELRIKETFDMTFCDLFNRLSLEGELSLIALMRKTAQKGDFRAMEYLHRMVTAKREDSRQFNPQNQEPGKLKFAVMGIDDKTSQDIAKEIASFYDKPRDN